MTTRTRPASILGLAVGLLMALGGGCASEARAPATTWQNDSIAYVQRGGPAPVAPFTASVPVGRTPPQRPGVLAASPARAPVATSGAFVYRFQAGDEVGIDVWQEKDLSGVQRVLRDGTISPPLLDPMPVEGLTIKEVRARLIAKYREYLKEPRITVRVASVQSDRMFILGEVKTPKAVPILGPMTLLQGIAEAGGFSEEVANKETIRVLRQTPGQRAQVITVNAMNVLAGRSPDLPMRAGDIVFVHPTGLADWSRKFSQALDPLSGVLGTAGDAAAIALLAR